MYFGCKSVFLHKKRSTGKLKFYEERVVIVQATEPDAARKKAIRVSTEYARDGIVFCDLISVFPILEERLEDGVEVFASFRWSKLEKREFADRFYFSKSCLTAGVE